ncbi:ATP-grasp domain-containing protein [Phocaeicola sp.]
MNILITAIGSMSAECVISALTKQGHQVTGCDIYPAEWHYASRLCSKVYQVPLATQNEKYINALMQVCMEQQINVIIPLTDIEIDILSSWRSRFKESGILLCIQSEYTLSIARNKYQLYQFFLQDKEVPSILTYQADNHSFTEDSLPCIAKPCNGRSSEGLMLIHTAQELDLLQSKENYILQKYLKGPIYTVDYVRCRQTCKDFAIPRKELLRTKNGAGLTVQLTNNEILKKQVSHIGNKLDINGCINMEFLYVDDLFYLIDVNPRFSAGIAFSHLAGYDMIISHLNCFINKDIMPEIDFTERLMTKRYKEEILS